MGESVGAFCWWEESRKYVQPPEDSDIPLFRFVTKSDSVRRSRQVSMFGSGIFGWVWQLLEVCLVGFMQRVLIKDCEGNN